MAIVTVNPIVPPGTYPQGDYTQSPVQSVAAGKIAMIDVSAQFTQVTAGTLFDFKVWLSTDGGATWQVHAEDTFDGGVSSKTGQLVTWTPQEHVEVQGPAQWRCEFIAHATFHMTGSSATVTTTP
jgi:hypothetical protein